MNIQEGFPLEQIKQENLLREGLKFYGQKKVASELKLLESDIPKKIILRPHFLFGRYDFQNTDYYWINRIKNYNKILLPNSGKDLIQNSFTDDFIHIILKSFTYSGEEIIFNATTHEPITLRQYLENIRQYFGKEIDFVDASNSFLVEQKVRPLYDLPFWNNSPNIIYNNEKLRQELNPELTPMKSAIHQTIALENEGGIWTNGKFGLTRTKELELFKLLK